MDAIRPFSEGPTAPPQMQSSAPASPDLIKILLRWKWLPILGSIFGATVGFLYFGQLPHKYKAVAQVQVVSPAKVVPINAGFNQQLDSHSRSDEIVVVQSNSVLMKAVEIEGLTQHRKLAGMSADQIVKMLRKPKVMEVKLGSNDLNSDILKIGVTTDDAELSGDLVRAVVLGYEDFVMGNIKGYTDEAEKVLTTFKESYDQSSLTAKKKLALINSDPNFILKNGKPHDPLTDKFQSLSLKISEIDQQIRNIDVVVKQVEEGREAKRSPEVLLQMIAQQTRDSAARDDSEIASQREGIRTLNANNDLFEQTYVLPLQSMLAVFAGESKGDSHPSVLATKQRLKGFEEQLATRKARAKALEEELNSSKSDIPSVEGRLNVAVLTLLESLEKFKKERAEILAEIDGFKERMQLNAKILNDYEVAVAELEAVSELSSQISENLRKLSMTTDIGQKTVSRLDLPGMGAFDGPYWFQYIGIGGLLGFVAFSGLAYLLEMADRSYRNPDEIASDLGMPIIGHLPLATISRTDRIDDKVDSSIVTLHKNRAPISEAFRGIRTSLFFSCQTSGIKVIQVTSPVPGDGKSTIAANIAVSIAQSGRRVCLVDCDFRRPRVAKIFGLREDTGFVQVIGGKIALPEAIQQTTVENLSALTCGRRPANPAELLSSEVFGDLISSLRNDFDFVIVDTPPMLAVSDPANVASHVDGVLLTIRLRRNLRPIATRAAQMLHAINANMIGVVVNGIGVGGNSYGYGGYRYDNYTGGRGSGYGKSGYGGYGYGSTYQYGGYYGGTNVGRDYYDDSIPKTAPKKVVKT